MKRIIKSWKEFGTAFRVGLFLAIRQVRRSSKWTTLLIIFVMTLTFLNLVVVSGILVGLIEGAVVAVKGHYTSDLFITKLEEKQYIEQSSSIVNSLENIPEVEAVTARYIGNGSIESNYKTKRKTTDLTESAGAQIIGIDPIKENNVTGLAKLIVEGEYLNENDYDKVVLGGMLLKKYLSMDSPGFPVLDNVGIGSKVRIKIGDKISREVIVKGIVRSKVDEVDRRVFFTDTQLRGMIGRTDYNVNEISAKMKPGKDPFYVKNILLSQGFDDHALIYAGSEGEPKFIKDMKNTFALLGTMISAIGLVVACITIFIVIFINAITRRKFIGILKGIGIDSTAIEIAYVLQSIFYAFVGTLFGFIFIFLFLKPYIDANPINFPFSDGILVATYSDTFMRAAILLFAAFIAGYIPARMVVKQNTLDAILGR